MSLGQHKETYNVFKYRYKGCRNIAVIFYFWCYLPPTLTAKDRVHAGRVSSSIHVSTFFSSSAVIHNHRRSRPRWCYRKTKLQKQLQLQHGQLFRGSSSYWKNNMRWRLMRVERLEGKKNSVVDVVPRGGVGFQVSSHV